MPVCLMHLNVAALIAVNSVRDVTWSRASSSSSSCCITATNRVNCLYSLFVWALVLIEWRGGRDKSKKEEEGYYMADDAGGMEGRLNDLAPRPWRRGADIRDPPPLLCKDFLFCSSSSLLDGLQPLTEAVRTQSRLSYITLFYTHRRGRERERYTLFLLPPFFFFYSGSDRPINSAERARSAVRPSGGTGSCVCVQSVI